MKKLTIGLFGFGVVGEGIYQVLKDKPALNAEIKRIVIKDDSKVRNAPAELFSTRAEDILEDQDINVVIELISDAEAAFTIIEQAFKRKKHVVSANKKLIAEQLTYLLALQKDNEVSFLYEAAVCGSVPIIRNLEEYFDNDLLNYVSGIVNGTTNYILTKMGNEKQSYADALSAAQSSGFAEADPTADVEGFDAASKLSIMALHAFGKIIQPHTVVKKGITAIQSADFNYAQEKDYTIKLIAKSFYDASKKHLTATVLPTFIPLKNTLALVDNEYNGVLIGSSLSDEQFLYGKGAGRFPTSSAVLSDLSALLYDYHYANRKLAHTPFDTNLLGRVKIYVNYSSYTGDIHQLEKQFKQVHERFQSENYSFIIGELDLLTLSKTGWLNDSSVSVIAFD